VQIRRVGLLLKFHRVYVLLSVFCLCTLIDWPPLAVSALISICKELEIDKLHLKGGKGKTKWTNVANQLSVIGYTYTYTPLQMKYKWQYEKCQFKKVHHNRNTGRSRLEYKYDYVMREAVAMNFLIFTRKLLYERKLHQTFSNHLQ
jgi:hypothetical protein